MKSGLAENRRLVGTGEIAIYDVRDTDRIRFVIEGSGGTNAIVIYARIIDQTGWDTIGQILGPNTTVFKIDTYDEIKLECTVFDGTDVRLLMSGYNDVSNS